MRRRPGCCWRFPGLATLAVSVPAGVAADRLGARRCTLLAGVVLCMSCFAQAAPSLPSLLVGRLLFGIAYGVLWTTGVAWLAELDPAPGGSRIGPSVTCASVGMMVGPAVGGLVAGAGGAGLPFLLIAIASAVVMVPLAIGGARAGRAAVARRRAGDRAAAIADGAAAVRGRGAAAGDEAVELARAVGYSESVELARAVGYSESVELASSLGYGEPVPCGGAESSSIRGGTAATGRRLPRSARWSSRARSRASANC